jgi:hypothetical protein
MSSDLFPVSPDLVEPAIDVTGHRPRLRLMAVRRHSPHHQEACRESMSQESGEHA